MNQRDSPNWNERYKSDDLPWETGRLDSNLRNIISEHSISPCKALEIGCGTGNNALWLALQGFDVTAIDLSPIAIEQAIAKSKNTEIHYQTVDILTEIIPNSPFSFIFDRGCFHSMNNPEKKKKYAQTVHDSLSDRGLWLTLAGNADDHDRETGPPRMTAEEIVSITESQFEILVLKRSYFDSEQKDPPACWACLMLRR